MSLWMLAACSPGPVAGSPGVPTCPDPEALFGRPSASTGLDASACGPSCGCFTAPEYDEQDVAAMRSWTQLDPPAVPTSDPYDDPVLEQVGVCAVVVEGDRTYRLETFPDAERAQGIVTHDGPCGLCSSLHDLAAYVAHPDLTGPVRDCGITGMLSGEEAHRACLLELGFTEACAEIWRYNTLHTQAVCLEVCLPLLDAPYHEPDGSLNACIQCDEDRSGAVFKAVAGRTRRNTGLASALCRPCDTVFPVIHDWR